VNVGGEVTMYNFLACRSEVTLVCTDVEGSTSMWEWNSAVMQDAIFIHDTIIRHQIAEHSGVEVMTEGDAFIVAFHDPYDALVYCMHVQVSIPRSPLASSLGRTFSASACWVSVLSE
jgi:class 3 adenylate cyclase